MLIRELRGPQACGLFWRVCRQEDETMTVIRLAKPFFDSSIMRPGAFPA
jgi:hypothetical protein